MTADNKLQPSGVKDIGTVTNTVTDLTLDSTSFNERYFPYISLSTAKVYEVGGADDGILITTAVTNYGTPDIYGNFTNVETTLTDNDSGSPYYNQQWTTTTATTYTEDHGTNWCLTMPTERDVTNTAPGVPSITRHVSFTPDYTECRQTQQVVEPSSSTYKVTTGYGYDTFGNLSSQTVTGVGMTARTTSTNFGSSGQFPTTIKNALGQTTQVKFDPTTGKQLNQIDPNGIKTSWQYDTFARKVNEMRPDGTSTTWAYNNCATAGCVNSNNEMTVVATTLNTDSSTLTIQNTYLDQFDRTLVTSKLMLNGAYDRNEVQYDNLGRVHLQGFPCTFVGCVQYWTTNYYDILNRLTESQRPISSTNSTLQSTLYTYQGRTSTVTDAQGKVTTQIKQVTNNVGRTKDHNGYYINFNRDAFGAVLSVTDSLSNTLSSTVYAYGIQAFPQSSTDMDLGARTYTVDALGEVTGFSDANGNSFTTTYDALSRPMVRTEPDLTTTWTWGTTAALYNIGKLQSVSAAIPTQSAYIEAYGYDSDGRVSTKTLTLPADTTYTYTYTYNATTGLLDTLQYPVSTSSYQLQLQYGYTHGILSSVSDSAAGTVYWQANTTNPWGQVTEETLGNGVITNRSFDAVTGWMGTLTAGPSGSSSLDNSSFLYDYVGNVTERQNNNIGLTENFYYDNLYRLDHSTLGGTTNLQMQYDTGGMGNIASRSDIAGGAAWTYDPVKKHAVTQAGSSSYTYTYDGNGNAITRNGYTVNWSSYNYPTGINSAGESAQFFYDPERQRWKTIYSGSVGTETTYHVGKLLEKVVNGSTTDYRHYIYAGNELVVIYSRIGTSYTHRYVLEDHQASFSYILSNTGGVDVRESFTAYGNRRDGNTWSGPPSNTDETTINGISRWGYTGETVLGVSMGLNHLNGRVQDSITGRFLSPDTMGQSINKTQSWNRYSYVSNNPVTFSDTTGFKEGKTLPYCGAGMKAAFLYNNRGDCSGSLTGSFVPFGSFGGIGTEGNIDDDVFGQGTADLTAALQALSAAENAAVSSALDGSSAVGSGTSAGGDSGGDAPSSSALTQGAAQSQNTSNQTGGALSFVGPAAVATGTEISIGAIISAAIGIFLPDSTSPDDTTEDTQDNDQVVFHYANDAKMAQVLANGAITPSNQGVVWVSPTNYTSAAAAQANLALPSTPTGYFIVPVQNVQTPLTWTVVQANFGQPGGGVEGTTPVAIPVNGAGGTIIWVPFK